MGVLMNYQEACAHALTVRWKIAECGTLDCWCRLVLTEDPVVFEHNGITEDVTIIGAGAVSKDFAEHLVNIHNKFIDDTQKN